LAIDPHYIRALTYKGLALDKLGNHTGAIGYYDRVLAIDPKDKLALILKLASVIAKHYMATLNTNNITHNSSS
jgi:tetratricopeptide (TPR) repeat protein